MVDENEEEEDRKEIAMKSLNIIWYLFPFSVVKHVNSWMHDV